MGSCRICCLLGMLSAGCGYSLDYRPPSGVTTVAVPIFQNHTFPLRRELEYDLTAAFRQEILSHTGLSIVPASEADMVVIGTIELYRENVISEGKNDQKSESVLTVIISAVIENYVSHRRSDLKLRVQEPFSPEQGETTDSVKNRAFKNLSERLLLSMESWDEE